MHLTCPPRVRFLLLFLSVFALMLVLVLVWSFQFHPNTETLRLPNKPTLFGEYFFTVTAHGAKVGSPEASQVIPVNWNSGRWSLCKEVPEKEEDGEWKRILIRRQILAKKRYKLAKSKNPRSKSEDKRIKMFGK